MSVRSPHEAYRSLPGTPLGMDHRSMAPTDINVAMNHARMALEVSDYFHPGASSSLGPRYSTGMRPRSPHVSELEGERYGPYEGECNSPEMICR